MGGRGQGAARAHQVILLRVCRHAPHPVAMGVLGQAVGKLLGGPRLGAVEHDDVPALGTARHVGSVRGKEPQSSLEALGDHRGRQVPQGHPLSCLLQVLAKSLWG